MIDPRDLVSAVALIGFLAFLAYAFLVVSADFVRHVS